MALKLNGRDDRLTRQDFLALARTIGLTAGDAEAAMDQIADRLARRLQTLSLPAFAGQTDAARGVQDKMIALIEARCAGLGGSSG
jgi:serine/threonine-protein kinase HipA